jgi:hypothetical protein
MLKNTLLNGPLWQEERGHAAEKWLPAGGERRSYFALLPDLV